MWRKVGIIVNQDNQLHKHEFLHLPTDGYGAAINSVDEMEDGALWIGNGEYGSQINFCPVCGYKAKKEVEIDEPK